MSNYIVCTYYTSRYEKYVSEFKSSLDSFNMPYTIKEMDDEGTWKLNVGKKMQFMRECLDEFRDNDCLWIDIDAKIVKYPSLFDDIQEDFAAYKYVVPSTNRKWVMAAYGCIPEFIYFTGTMYFKNNDKCRLLLDNWIEKHKEYTDFRCPEQMSLYQVLKNNHDIEVLDLPKSYCWIVSPDNDGERVIEHYCETAIGGI